MKAGRKSNKTRPSGVLKAWQAKETSRIDNLRIVGDSGKVSPQHDAFVKALGDLIEEHDKLLKYARLVVKCHENHNFSENVAALRSYLVEELGIET